MNENSSDWTSRNKTMDLSAPGGKGGSQGNDLTDTYANSYVFPAV